MYEIIVMIALFNGTRISTTIIKILQYIITYYEIYDKLGYGEELRLTEFLFAYTIHDKNRNICYKYMSRLLHTAFALVDRFEYSRDQQKQARKNRLKARVERHAQRLALSEDVKKHAEMKGLGFHRCDVCKYYNKPKTLLHQVSELLLPSCDKMMMTGEYKQELKRMILNQDRKKPRCVSEFDKFEEVFFYPRETCLKCKHCSHSKGFSDFMTPEMIVKLQEDDLRMVYHNLPVLEFENNFT